MLTVKQESFLDVSRVFLGVFLGSFEGCVGIRCLRGCIVGVGTGGAEVN